jgi:hypothetical protein
MTAICRGFVFGLSLVQLAFNITCFFIAGKDMDANTSLAYTVCAIGLFGMFLYFIVRKFYGMAIKLGKIVLCCCLVALYAIGGYEYSVIYIKSSLAALFWIQMVITITILCLDALDDNMNHDNDDLLFIRADPNIPDA